MRRKDVEYKIYKKRNIQDFVSLSVDWRTKLGETLNILVRKDFIKKITHFIKSFLTALVFFGVLM